MAAAVLVPIASATSAAASRAAPRAPRVLHVGQIASQDIAPQPGSEPDTLVEPHVAVSPVQPHTAVAVAHDGRFADGGAVDISYAWTRDGGGHWQHAPVPGLTKAFGGAYDRASDPVVQFAADGTAYLSTLLFATPPGCPSAVAVSRSNDGGATWGAPVLVHASDTCDYSDDKNWLVIDNSPTSPHFGRIYQFWTAFVADGNNNFTSPQVVRFSDDQGSTWSATFPVNPVSANTQDSQPMILADGTIVDTYQNYGPSRVGGESPIHRGPPRRHAADQIAPTIALSARTSVDGGRTWGNEVTVTNDVGPGPADVRCCIPAANIDHATGRMYAVWEGAALGDTDPVEMSTSTNGADWTAPQTISHGDVPGVQEVNVAVAADHGHVFVTYGVRTDAADNGGFVQQKLSYSADGGATFGSPLALGPVSSLRFAAQAGGLFPGDYIGMAITADRLYLVWCVSSPPPTPSPYHQVLFAGVLRF
ncbi:MAG: glycoside hydrolase [Actinomycetota bacterium]|nr:glycoside hydrolase [Actinomycetota bacterium]